MGREGSRRRQMAMEQCPRPPRLGRSAGDSSQERVVPVGLTHLWPRAQSHRGPCATGSPDPAGR